MRNGKETARNNLEDELNSREFRTFKKPRADEPQNVEPNILPLLL